MNVPKENANYHRVIIDVGNLQQERKTDSIFYDIHRIKNFTKNPIHDKLMKSVELMQNPSEDLLSEMQQEVDKIYAAMFDDNEPSKEARNKKISEIKTEDFQTAKILAAALVAIDEGKNLSSTLLEEITKYHKELEIKNDADFHRDRIIVNVNGEVLAVRDAEELQALFPEEITKEQAEYIAYAGSQFLIASSGVQPLEGQAARAGMMLQTSKDPGLVTRYVEIKDGKVQIVSSKKFNVLDDKDIEAPPKGSLRASLVVDISSLKGDQYEIGRASGEVTFHNVFESDSENVKSVLEQISKQAQNALVKEGSVSTEISQSLQDALHHGAEMQVVIGEGDFRTPEQTRLLVDSQKKKSERLSKLPLHEQVYLFEKNQADIFAESLSEEYAKGSPLSEAILMKIGISPPDANELTGIDLEKAKIKVAIDAHCYREDRKEARYKFAAKKLASSTKDLKKEDRTRVLESFEPEERLEVENEYRKLKRKEATIAATKQMQSNQEIGMIPRDSLTLEVAVYAGINTNIEDRIDFAAERLASTNTKLDSKAIESILNSITPPDKTKSLNKNSKNIAKLISESDRFEDKKSKLIEKIGVTIAPEITAKNVGKKLVRQISAPSLGRKERKNEFKRSQSSLGP